MGVAVGRDDHIIDSITADGQHAHGCATNRRWKPRWHRWGMGRCFRLAVTQLLRYRLAGPDPLLKCFHLACGTTSPRLILVHYPADSPVSLSIALSDICSTCGKISRR
jgi:hypothetical protein